MTRHATEDDLLMDLIKTNRETDGETMTKKQYQRHGDNNPWQAVNRFGSWNEAKAAAGIYKDQERRLAVKNQEILEDLKKVNEKVDGSMTTEDYKKHGKYSISTIYNRFESFPSARNKAYNI